MKAFFSLCIRMYPDIWKRKAKCVAGQKNIIGFYTYMKRQKRLRLGANKFYEKQLIKMKKHAC